MNVGDTVLFVIADRTARPAVVVNAEKPTLRVWLDPQDLDRVRYLGTRQGVPGVVAMDGTAMTVSKVTRGWEPGQWCSARPHWMKEAS